MLSLKKFHEVMKLPLEVIIEEEKKYTDSFLEELCTHGDTLNSLWIQEHADRLKRIRSRKEELIKEAYETDLDPMIKATEKQD